MTLAPPASEPVAQSSTRVNAPPVPSDVRLPPAPWQFQPESLGWLVWLTVFGLFWRLCAQIRGQIEQVHPVLGFLLIVLGAAATSTRRLALAIAIGGALAINLSFEQPYGTFFVNKLLDALILVGFLACALLATQLVSTARRQAAEARRRAAEVETLAMERIRLIAENEHAGMLQEAARAKDALLAAVSHDLRTPLTTIITLAEQAAGRGETGSASIGREATRLSHLVENLLEYSRVRAGAWPVRLEATIAEDVLGAVANEVRARIADHPLTVRVRGDDLLLAAQLDEVLAVRILANLVENAVKYAPAGSPILFEAFAEDGTVVFAVTDDGPGIPELERDRVFEAFYRGERAAPDVGGVGLGLAIARALAELQQGTLVLARTGGTGTRMEFRVKRAVIEEPPALSS